MELKAFFFIQEGQNRVGARDVNLPVFLSNKREKKIHINDTSIV